MKIGGPALSLVASLVLFTESSFAAPGDLDPGFGSGGVVRTDVGANSGASDVAIQPDGSIVVVGHTTDAGGQFAVVRYDDGGSLDATFGSGGIVTTAIGTSATARAVALQADGMIVVGGSAVVGGTTMFAIARYDELGALDPGFGSGGVVTTTIGDSSQINDLLLQSDGSIVAVGSRASGGTAVAIARYDDAGVPDVTFGVGGVVTTIVGTTSSAEAVTALAGDAFAVAGYSDDDFLLVSYSAGGVPNPGFGAGGIVTTEIEEPGTNRLYGITRQGDGKLVVTGNVDNLQRITVARYLANGSPDAAFGPDGTGRNDSPEITLAAYGKEVEVLTDGRIVVAGYLVRPDGPLGSGNHSASEFAVLSFDSDGEAGLSLFEDLGNDEASFEGLAIQPDGYAVASGRTGYSDIYGADVGFLTARIDLSICGDEIVEGPEECDDGDNQNGDGCDNNCTATGCGNGIVTTGEACDGTECCSASCTFEDGSVSCTSDDEPCTDDQCDGAGQCAHVPNTAPCDDYSDCTSGDVCSGGTCQGTLTVQCPSCEYCQPWDGQCAVGPRTDCLAPVADDASKLAVRLSTDPAERRVTWRWRRGEATPSGTLGDPGTIDDYAICMFGGAGQLGWSVPLAAGTICGSKPCWKVKPDVNISYSDRSRSNDGVDRLSVKAGDEGESQLLFKARGENVPALDTYLPFDSFNSIRLQLQRSNGACWDASHRIVNVKSHGRWYLEGQ